MHDVEESPKAKVPQRSKYGFESRRPVLDKPSVYDEGSKPNVVIHDVELSVYSAKEISKMDIDEKLNASLMNMSTCNIWLLLSIYQ